jgi:inactive dipeptidyl peptidase 10
MKKTVKCRYLLKNVKNLDATRVGIWGWGYGGYVTTMILGSNKRIFSCGTAISPITDWLYYSE